MKQFVVFVYAVSTVVIAAEAWFAATGDTSPPAAAVQPTVAAPQATTYTAPPEKLVDQWIAVALAQPLFAPNRRPSPGHMATDAGMPRLAGLIVLPADATAIFQPSGDAKPIALRRGESVNGWTVAMITP